MVAAVAGLLVFGLGSGLAASGASTPPAFRVAWIDGLHARTTETAVQALLDRRAAAVRAKDRSAFLADVDSADPVFFRRQTEVFENLIQLPLDDLAFIVEPAATYASVISPQAIARYRAAVYAPGVTVRYRISGVDSRSVTAPWVPVLGYSGHRWVIAAEAADKGLPYGVNGQAWDAGPISVVTSSHVVAAMSREDAGNASYLLGLAERGLGRVYAVRQTGWTGKVFLTAVQDRRIFDTYFSNAPERVAEVAAIAVPYYDQVLDWHANGAFAATRVVFNPQQLSAQPEELEHDLAHEFTHAAMGAVTVTATPRWLVEGFAEYVAYKGETIAASAIRRSLHGTQPTERLPADGTFYDEPGNYVTSWLACRMLVERYGEAKVIALYTAFQQQGDQETNLNAILGLGIAGLTTQWREYVKKRLT